tara:strand:- start:5740 stop:6639 length:900 start_codon:yes stop_codon:yes gene_type:complete
MKKRIIITGGTGQDGVILSKLLLKKKYQVYSLINKKIFTKTPKVNFINVNLLNSVSINKIIKTVKPYAIIHLASKNISKIQLKSMKYRLFYKENYLITRNIVDSILKNDNKVKLIFAGSSQMFKKTNGIVNEKSKFMSSCYYSKYKIDSHNYIIKMKKKFNLIATTAILFNHDSKYRNSKFLLPRLAKYLHSNKLNLIKEIYQQNIFSDFSHADDVCFGIFLLLNSKKNLDKIILSSGKLSSINSLIDFALMKLKIINKLETPKKRTIKLIGNNNLAKKSLKWNIKKDSLTAFKEILKN